MSVLAPARPHSRRSWLWFSALILMALLLFLPLRLALGLIGEPGVSARAAGGTIWSGRLVDARLGGFDLGTIDTSLRPLPLALGRLRFNGTRVGGAPLSGSAEAGWGRRAVHDLSGNISGGQLGNVPIDQVTLDAVTIIFSGGRCVEASGRVRLALSALATAAALPSLSGAPRCDDGALLLPLTGDSGLERLNLRIDADGRYSGTLGTGGANPVLRIAGRL